METKKNLRFASAVSQLQEKSLKYKDELIIEKNRFSENRIYYNLLVGARFIQRTEIDIDIDDKWGDVLDLKDLIAELSNVQEHSVSFLYNEEKILIDNCLRHLRQHSLQAIIDNYDGSNNKSLTYLSATYNFSETDELIHLDYGWERRTYSKEDLYLGIEKF